MNLSLSITVMCGILGVCSLNSLNICALCMNIKYSLKEISRSAKLANVSFMEYPITFKHICYGMMQCMKFSFDMIEVSGMIFSFVPAYL